MKSDAYTPSVDRLIHCLTRMPGIGRRSAERLVFYLLKQPAEEAQELAEAVRQVKQRAQQCSICCNLSESDPCPICAQPRRQTGQIMVVEEPADVLSFESTGMFAGRYHVLMGRIAPLEGVDPEHLTLDQLMRRLEREEVDEVILGTSPTLEGDATALHLGQTLRRYGCRVTRLARGLPAGHRLEHASKAVLSDALEGRQSL
jgi:recombination protein RecR